MKMKKQMKNGKVYFNNPLTEKNTQKMNDKYTEGLDDNGFIKEGTYVTDDNIIISKCSKKISLATQLQMCSGKRSNFGTSGIVDKVSVVKNKEGLRTCKIRIRKIKVAGIGDKFASRCGQKGMCGMVLESWEMPFTSWYWYCP